MEARTTAENAKNDKAEDYALESSYKTPESGLEQTYSVASVVAFIAAGTLESKSIPRSYILRELLPPACLAHFILVVGGFTSDKGYQKLLAVFHRLSSIL